MKELNGFEIHNTPEEVSLESCLQIRKEVFTQEQGIPEDLDNDGKDDEALHVLVCKEGMAIGTGRMVREIGNAASLARIAVVPAWRGRGLGKLIVKELEEVARQHGIHSTELNCHLHLEPFYAAMGYERTSNKTSAVAGHLLLNMRKNL